MKPTPFEHETVAFYNHNASGWAKQHTGVGFWAKEMAKFKQYLPTGAVLEIGCGSGRDAKELAALGYEYVGTDISASMVRIVQKNNPNLTFFQQSVYELDFSDNTFDGFWAAAVLLHIPKVRMNEALGKIHTVVKPDGMGFISIKDGEEERFEKGRLYNYYHLDEFVQVLNRNDFSVLESKLRQEGDAKRLIYLVKNNKLVIKQPIT